MYRDCEGRNKTLFVHRWHDRLCRKPERINKKTTELLSDYSKVSGYIQKSISLLYINDE